MYVTIYITRKAALIKRGRCFVLPAGCYHGQGQGAELGPGQQQ